jgi:hypothetical protein
VPSRQHLNADYVTEHWLGKGFGAVLLTYIRHLKALIPPWRRPAKERAKKLKSLTAVMAGHRPGHPE